MIDKVYVVRHNDCTGYYDLYIYSSLPALLRKMESVKANDEHWNFKGLYIVEEVLDSDKPSEKFWSDRIWDGWHGFREGISLEDYSDNPIE